MEKIKNLNPVVCQPIAVEQPGLRASVCNCVVTEIATLEDIEKLRPFWSQCETHPDADIDFYSLFVSLRAAALKPYVLLATREGQPKAMWIGRLENSSISMKAGYRTLLNSNIRQITFLQEGYLGESSAEIASAMVNHIRGKLKAGFADRAYVANTDPQLEIYRAAQGGAGILTRDYTGRETERWRTKLPANMDEFLKRRSKKHRYWLRRIGRVFEEAYAGKVRYETLRGKDDIERFCAAAEQIAQTTYQRGLGVGFLDTSETRRRLELAAAKGWLRVYLVFVGDEPVAFWSGRLYHNVMYLEWTGFKPAYRKYEAGTVLFLKMLEDLCSSGAQEVDYGVGTSGYKERFGDYKLIEGSVCIYAPTIKGITANFLVTLDVTVNRTAKSIARKLGIVDWVKKRWRSKLAGKRTESADESLTPGEVPAE